MALFSKALFALLAAMSVVATANAADDSDLLPVQEAFKLTAGIAEPGTARLHWDIADGYYLYRARIHAKASEDGASLGELALPSGEKKHDEFLGDVEVYHHQVEATVPYQLPLGRLAPNALVFSITVQGCHEDEPKICYPPFSQKLTLALPVATSTTDGAGTLASPTSANAALAQALGKTAAVVDGTPLPPEHAFVFEAINSNPNAILARWTMPKGYYLYRDKTQLVSLERVAGNGALATTPPQMRWPDGVKHQDENFGDTVVYFNQVEVPITFQRSNPDALTVALRMAFQGCQDNGVCYPVMTRMVTVAIPKTTPMDYATSTTEGQEGRSTNDSSLSEEQRLASALSGNRLLALLSFFGFGLLLAFTPCVFPMIPILSGIIVGAGENISTRRAFILSLVYVLASSVIFTIAGVFAGLAGKNLQAAFQTPWVLWGFAGVFVLLSLSMFGFYELQLPSSWQAKIASLSGQQRSGSLSGVAVMGMLSALIVGPCVAPPLAGAVLYISQTRDPIFGGVALFVLSLGMGAPLLLLGSATGTILPRAGAWMDAVKAVFGVMFLLLAIFMLARILDPQWIMSMAGALLVTCAVYLGALERLPEPTRGWRKLRKALGVLLLLVGAAELLGAVAGGQDLMQPLKGIVVSHNGIAASEPSFAFKVVRSPTELDRELAIAKAVKKAVMLDFYADWCVSCKEMEKFTFSDAAVQKALADHVLLKADVTASNDDAQALLARFNLIGPPTTIFFAPDGLEQRSLRLTGFEDAAKFLARLMKAEH